MSLAVLADNLAPAFVMTLFPGIKNPAMISRYIYIGWLIGAPLMGWFTELCRSRRLLLISGSLCAAVTFIVLLLLSSPSRLLVECLLCVFGFFCSVEILCFTTITDQVPIKKVGISMSAVNFIVMLVNTCVLPFTCWMLDLFWTGGYHVVNHKAIRLYTLHAYHLAFIVIPVLCMLAAFLAFVLKESYPKVSEG